METIIGIIIATTLAIGLIIIVTHYEKKLEKEKNKISFKEAMDIVNVPIITFNKDGKKLNFILDTGSDLSYISPRVSKIFKREEATKVEASILGFSGEANNVVNIYCTTLAYKNHSFDVELIEGPTMEEAFNTIKKEKGVIVHGLLGSQFLKKYKYILDFDELIAYNK